jgi:hypothetical protein
MDGRGFPQGCVVMKDRHYVGVVGVLVSVAGWLVLSADHFPMVCRALAPEYTHARSALGRMQTPDHVLRKGDAGFREIAEIIGILMERDLVLPMVRIRSLAAGQGPVKGREGMKLVDYMRLEVFFENGAVEVWEIGGLETAIRQRYRTLDVFLWGSVIFGVGMVLCLLSVVMKEE